MKSQTRNGTSIPMMTTVAMVSVAAFGPSVVANAADFHSHESEGMLSSADISTQPAVELQQMFPEARFHLRGGRAARIYGQRMSTGASPQDSAEAFRSKVAKALTAVPNEIRLSTATDDSQGPSASPVGLMFDQATGQYRFYLYRYRQVRGDTPVHDADLLTLVKNEKDYPVVWGSSTLRDLKDFVPATEAEAKVDEDKARAAILLYADANMRDAMIPRTFSRFKDPHHVIFAGAGDRQESPRMAIRYLAENDDPPARMTFVADAATGEILHAVDLMPANVSGTVRGISTSGPNAWDSSDPSCASMASFPLPYSSVAVAGGASGFTDRSGYFYLVDSSVSVVTVISVIDGQYFLMSDYSAPLESVRADVYPGIQADVVHNRTNTDQYVRAQTMAYVHVNRARDFLLSYLPEFPGISTLSAFPVKVNYSGSSCPNAWGGGFSLIFCGQTGAAKNAAFGAVVYHEFGHTIIYFAGGGQGAYGEGMADSISTALDEVPGYAYGWGTNPCTTPQRWAQNTCQYSASNCSSCGSEAHACGQLLSGIIWDIRQRLKVTHSGDYSAILNPLMFSSIALHPETVIDAATAVDFLTLDDNDGNISNGTPHSAEICAGFAAHGIACPAMSSTPCSSYCADPVALSWSGNYGSGSLGTGAVCLETTQIIHGGNCGSLATGRQFFLNGQLMSCNGNAWSAVPAPVNGGYCISTTEGNYAWAFFTLW